MSYPVMRVFRFVSLGAATVAASAFTPVPAAPSAGMTFKLKVTLRHTPTSGRARGTVTLLGHGVFAGGMGRVTIDTVDVPSVFRKADFFIIRDSTNTFWARPSTMTVRRLNAPLANPLEAISASITSGMGSPRSLKVVFDTVSLGEEVNGYRTQHYRITADVVYPIGQRSATQKVVIDQWLTHFPMRVMNPFTPRVRGLPDSPAVNAAYREFIRTLAAANHVYGDAVTVRTITMTSTIYAPGLGEDFFQTVDLTDIQPADVDDREFQLSASYKLQRAARDTTRPPTQE